MKKISLIQNIIRGFGLLQIVTGIIFWTGHMENLVIVHIILGSVMAAGLFILAIQAGIRGISAWLIALSIVWAIGLPAWGLLQDKIFPGPYNWVTQVLHLVCGVGAIGLSEILSMKLKNSFSKRTN